MGEPTLELLRLLRPGRAGAISAQALGSTLGVSPRIVGRLVEVLRGKGHLIGSSCHPSSPGYFLIENREELAEGTAHIRSRAVASLRVVRGLEKAAGEQFGPQAARLFDLQEVASS